MFSLFICFAPTFFTSAMRVSANELEYWDFSGGVEAKYNSRNHYAESITINGTNYESIPNHIWKKIRVGDLLTKKKCSDTITINQRSYKFWQ